MTSPCSLLMHTKGCGTPGEGEAIEYLREDRQRFSTSEEGEAIEYLGEDRQRFNTEA